MSPVMPRLRRLPRLGFLGVGWIGRARMRAIAESGLAQVVAVADADPSTAEHAAAPVGATVAEPGEVLGGGLGLDAVVIATPSALHAEQTATALDSGLAVFCQKPLGRTAAECVDVIERARRADRLLGVDLSYRFAEGVQRMRELVAGGAIGSVYAADLVFHNAYGPDKAWFLDPALAGGGCVIDLGTHLIDLGLWMLDHPKVDDVSARLFRKGQPFEPDAGEVEDFASVRIDLAGGATLSLACSWFLPAGCDAVIGATFFGTAGAVSLRNVDGSFYDFRAERMTGTRREVLAVPPDPWGGRAAIDWVARVAGGSGYDAGIESALDVAAVIDRVYGR
jgi:predicted dehydrogenase